MVKAYAFSIYMPSLIDSMDKIISSLFLLLNTYSSSGVSSGESHELCQLCFRVSRMFYAVLLVYIILYY